MRRLALLVTLLCVLVSSAVLLAACGGDDSGGGGALDESLGYLPENAAFAIVFNTDPDSEQFKNINTIVNKFPFSGQIKKQLQDQLASQQVNYEQDIKPLLGNPFVIGVTDARDAVDEGGSDSFVGAIKVDDKDKLEELIEKGGELREAGEHNGAKLYESNDGSATAIDDDVVVFANDQAKLKAALDQADGDNKLDEDKFDEALGDLPDDALMRFYADLEAILKADPDSAEALKVKWVGALRKLGLTASVESNAIKVDFDLNTESDGLTDADLPLATGDEAPPVVKREGEFSFGLRGANQIVKFAQAAGQAVDPRGFGQFVTAKKQINEALKLDVDKDIVDQFSGESAITVDQQGGFGVRAVPKDAAALEKTLETLADNLPAASDDLGLGTVGIAKPRGGDDFYAVATEDDRFVMGVVEDVFVLSDDPEKAAALATANPEKIEGAKGALVGTANVEELADQVIQQQAQGIEGLGAGLFTRPLGDLTQWVEADTSGLRGTARLGID
jgi:hypothetical protein